MFCLGLGLVPHDLQGIQRLLQIAARRDLRDAVGRLACVEGRRQGVRDRRLGRWQQSAHHLQGLAARVRDAEGQARLPARALSRLARHEVDPELREARSLGQGSERLSQGVPPHRRARPLEEAAKGTGAA
jgi:hypothetical protein